jgi:hypothetical protein
MMHQVKARIDRGQRAFGALRRSMTCERIRERRTGHPQSAAGKDRPNIAQTG